MMAWLQLLCVRRLTPEDGEHSEHLKEVLTETGARFGVLVTEENAEPDSWGFYELVTANREPQTREPRIAKSGAF